MNSMYEIYYLHAILFSMQVLILYHNKAMMYGVYRRHVQDEVVDNEIKEYALLVGKHCALNMLYFID